MNHPDHPDYDPCKMSDPLSTCCGDPPLGIVEHRICSGCRDHAVFEDNQPEQVTSIREFVAIFRFHYRGARKYQRRLSAARTAWLLAKSHL